MKILKLSCAWICGLFVTTTQALALETSLSNETFFIGAFHNPATVNLNPGNSILLNPSSEQLFDLRSDWRILGEHSKFVVRPRFTFAVQQISETAPGSSQQTAIGQVDLTDLYFENSLSSDWLLSAGLLVEGWGPAEFVNPSNPFLHLNLQNKNFTYREKGKALLKSLWNPSGQDTFSVEIEPISNTQPAFQESTAFYPSWAVRAEHQALNNTWIGGLTAGQDFAGHNFVGHYLTLSNPDTGWSVYEESRETWNAQRFEVGSNGAFPVLNLQTQTNPNLYSALGLRWEGRSDLRLEWIFYETGYSETEWTQITTALGQLTPFSLSNAAAFASPGLELLTKNWLSLSLRTPDIGPSAKWQVINRLLVATGDSPFHSVRSGFWQMDWEAPAFQAWTFYLETRLGFGNSNTELLLSDWSNLTVGGRLAF